MKLKIVALMISVGSFMVLSGQLTRVPLFPEFPSVKLPLYGRMGLLDAHEGPNGTITRKEYKFLRRMGAACSCVAGATFAIAVKSGVQAAQSGCNSTCCISAAISYWFINGTYLAERAAHRILRYINKKVDAGKVRN